MALLAVEGAVHHIAGITQRGGELAIEIGVILDHEEAHLWFSSLPQSAASMCHRGSMRPLCATGGVWRTRRFSPVSLCERLCAGSHVFLQHAALAQRRMRAL